MNTKKLNELYRELGNDLMLNQLELKDLKKRTTDKKIYENLEKHIELEKKQYKLILAILCIENEKKAL